MGAGAAATAAENECDGFVLFSNGFGPDYHRCWMMMKTKKEGGRKGWPGPLMLMLMEAVVMLVEVITIFIVHHHHLHHHQLTNFAALDTGSLASSSSTPSPPPPRPPRDRSILSPPLPFHSRRPFSSLGPAPSPPPTTSSLAHSFEISRDRPRLMMMMMMQMVLIEQLALAAAAEIILGTLGSPHFPPRPTRGTNPQKSSIAFEKPKFLFDGDPNPSSLTSPGLPLHQQPFPLRSSPPSPTRLGGEIEPRDCQSTVESGCGVVVGPHCCCWTEKGEGALEEEVGDGQQRHFGMGKERGGGAEGKGVSGISVPSSSSSSFAWSGMGQTGIEWEKNGVTPGAEGEEDIKKATKDDDGRGEGMILCCCY
ncbi:hypothetical protein niasHT_010148 [Heterodera trifolii]|uniref:Uncharacterized protein n=1 Tax=Heterodera trifolii TaxID=157864 RepID=A0ABD2LXL2_9BILA